MIQLLYKTVLIFYERVKHIERNTICNRNGSNGGLVYICRSRSTGKWANSKICQIRAKGIEESGEVAVGTRSGKVPGETRTRPAPHKNIKYVRSV